MMVPGLVVGKRFHTNEDIVIRESDGLVVRSRAVNLMAGGVNPASFERIRGTPWAPQGEVQDSIPEIPRAPVEPTATEEEPESGGPVPRAVRITREVVSRYGPSPGCLKCRAWARGDMSQPTRPHTPACRARLEQCMREDESTRRMVEEADARRTRYMAEEVEKAVKKAKPKAKSKSSGGPSDVGSLFVHSGDMLGK